MVDGEKPEIDSRAKGMKTHQYTGSARDYIQLAVGDELSRLVGVAPLHTGVVDSSYQTQHRQTHSYCPSVTHMVKAGPWSISTTRPVLISGSKVQVTQVIYTSTHLPVLYIRPAVTVPATECLCSLTNTNLMVTGGSVAKWLACRTQAQKGQGSDHSRKSKLFTPTVPVFTKQQNW